MKVLMIQGSTWAGKILHKGEVYEIPESSAQILLQQKQAIVAPEPEEKHAPELVLEQPGKTEQNDETKPKGKRLWQRTSAEN